MKRSKKLQDVTILGVAGVSYRLKIEVGYKSEYDHVFNDYAITLPWGDTVHADTAEAVVAKATAVLREHGEVTPVKILGVSIEGGNHSWNDLPKEQSASLVLNWTVGYSLKLRDGNTVYFKADCKTRDYGWRWEREIPWTQEAEDALKNVTRQLHTVRDTVQTLVASDKFEAALTGNGMLLLPPAGKGKR